MGLITQVLTKNRSCKKHTASLTVSKQKPLENRFRMQSHHPKGEKPVLTSQHTHTACHSSHPQPRQSNTAKCQLPIYNTTHWEKVEILSQGGGLGISWLPACQQQDWRVFFLLFFFLSFIHFSLSATSAIFLMAKIATCSLESRKGEFPGLLALAETLANGWTLPSERKLT